MILMTMVCAATMPGGAEVTAPYQYAFTIWNWESTYRDLDAFKAQVDACVAHGFTLIEVGAGWMDCEQVEGEFDFSMVEERVNYVRSKGLGVRLRLNMADWPEWFSPERYRNPDGEAFAHRGGFPSVFNEKNRMHQLRFAGELARHFQGQGLTYTPGFSVHMEVKFAAWNTYEDSAVKAFRDWLAGRYGNVEALNAAWRTELDHFGQVMAPVPPATDGEPSLDPASNDWIRFRSFGLAEWVRAFAATVRAGDATARISVPLGESFRRESAPFANHDYWGYSRRADEVVHSYDFFWHGPDGVENARTAAATMVGITQRPCIFEIDGPYLFDRFGYTPGDYVAAARLALDGGAAGIQVTNWGSTDVAEHEWMSEVGRLVQTRAEKGPWILPGPAPVLYYVSKWQNYCFRESSEWVHDRQFAFWIELAKAGVPARIVTDDNVLHERLAADVMVLPFDVLIDAPVRERLRALSHGMRMIADNPPGLYTATGKASSLSGAKVEVTGTPFAEDPRPVTEIIAGKGGESHVLRLGAAQFHTSYNIKENAGRILRFLEQAASEQVRVVAFSEMALTGYTKQASFRDELDWDAVDKALERIKTACKTLGLYAIVGAPTRDGDDLFCSAIAIDPEGTVIDAYGKIYRAGERWAQAGRRMSTFEIDGVKTGTFICHDERYPPLVQLRALAGAQLFVCISCESGLSADHKLDTYCAQLRARAAENRVYLVHVNAPALRDNLAAPGTSHGQSRIFDPDGNILAEGPVFEDALVVADVDMRYASEGGMDAALTEGPLALWMQQGVEFVQGPDDE